MSRELTAFAVSRQLNRTNDSIHPTPLETIHEPEQTNCDREGRDDAGGFFLR